MRQSPEASLLRIGAIIGLIGTVLGGSANVVHPAPAERALDAQVRLVAAYGPWIPIHVVIAIGGLLVLGGLLAISRSVAGATAVAVARVAFAVALVGIALNTVEMATDGIGLKLAADAWAGAPDPDKAAAFYGAYAISRIGAGLAFMQVIVLFGLTVGTFGVALALGVGYPRWLGWVGVAIGLLNLAIGIARAIAPATLVLPIGVSVSVGLVWIAVVFGFLWSRGTPAPGAVGRA